MIHVTTFSFSQVCFFLFPCCESKAAQFVEAWRKHVKVAQNLMLTLDLEIRCMSKTLLPIFTAV